MNIKEARARKAALEKELRKLSSLIVKKCRHVNKRYESNWGGWETITTYDIYCQDCGKHLNKTHN